MKITKLHSKCTEIIKEPLGGLVISKAATHIRNKLGAFAVADGYYKKNRYTRTISKR